jgi:hypothetical protein
MEFNTSNGDWFVLNPLGILAGLIVLGLLVAGVVVLFVKLRAKAWWIVGPVLGLGLLVVLAGLMWPDTGAAPSREYNATYSRTRGADGGSDTINVIRSTPVRASSDSASAERLSETFLADVYPSALQAAEALAAHVARSFHSSPDQSAGTVGSAEPPSPARPADAAALPDVLVTGRADAMILQPVADALGKGALARSVRITSHPAATAPASQPAPSPEPVICVVRVDGAESGTVQIVLESADRQITRAARFVSKPWAANFAQYVAGTGKPVVRAMSAPAASFEQAQEEAFADAVRKLVPYVNSAIGPTVDDGKVDSQTIRDAVLAELRKGKMVKDRFGQQFDRPYGKLWREQILVDASPEQMRRLAAMSEFNQAVIADGRLAAINAARQTWWTLTVSLGGLAVLIFAVYLVLNAATKGYYTWVLRLLAVGAILAGAVLACLA